MCTCDSYPLNPFNLWSLTKNCRIITTGQVPAVRWPPQNQTLFTNLSWSGWSQNATTSLLTKHRFRKIMSRKTDSQFRCVNKSNSTVNSVSVCWQCKISTYIIRKKLIWSVYPRLSNVSNSFAVFCLTCLFQCLTKMQKKPQKCTFLCFSLEVSKINSIFAPRKRRKVKRWTRDSHHVQMKKCLLQCVHFRQGRRLP